MVAKMRSVILTDSESSDHRSVLNALSEQGFRCEETVSLDETARRLKAVDFDAFVIYQHVAVDCFRDFLVVTRYQHPGMAIIVVIPEYDGDLECRLFDLQVDDVVTRDYSPSLLALRTTIRAVNRQKKAFLIE